MYSRLWKPIVLTSLGVLLAIPVCADVRVGLGDLRIRIANDAPPPQRYERRSERPDRDSVWISGWWHRQDDRWEQPRDRHAHWVKAQYKHEHHAWRYEPAHWSHEQLSEGDDY